MGCSYICVDTQARVVLKKKHTQIICGFVSIYIEFDILQDSKGLTGNEQREGWRRTELWTKQFHSQHHEPLGHHDEQPQLCLNVFSI